MGVDGGGTKCRARLCDLTFATLGEGVAGPANIRRGVGNALEAVLHATHQCLFEAGLSVDDLRRTTACLALAGASEPGLLAEARAAAVPFGLAVITSDAHAACVGAHRGSDGGIIIAGTGSIGWAEIGGRHYRVGGWGLPVSDEGSGAWLGCEALRRVLWAMDGRIASSGLLDALAGQFGGDPHAIVRWAHTASPRDFGSLAPLVAEYAERNDPVGVQLMRMAAGHVDALAARLVSLGVSRVSLAGGLASPLQHWVAEATLAHLVQPAGDALDGALQLARAAAQEAHESHVAQ
jgi:glucosamine kinase